jgi:2-polyprenyl-3-methyl-5-hydroxy-6-metoxy-1,4-benzoquinol methylase
MQQNQRTTEETRIARQYFGSFAQDYHRAFEGTGANPLHRLINRLFRRKTFVLRTALVERELREFGVGGKTVLDLGCGSGEVSLIAARLGASVTGIDIVPAMVEIATAEARAAGLSATTQFRVGNILEDALPKSDVAMMVGVIEYYSDLPALLKNVCAATGQLLIIVDTRGPLWRRMLRYTLARLKHFVIFYRDPDIVSAIAAKEGFVEARRVLGHSYSFFAFRRRDAAA